jgi:invasion protein IalB
VHGLQRSSEYKGSTMTHRSGFRPSLKIVGLCCLGATIAVSLWTIQVAAETTYYDTGGRIQGGEPTQDNFRPVWQQQQPQPKAKQEAAQAKQKAGNGGAAAEAPNTTIESKPEQPPAKSPSVRIETVRHDGWTVTCRETSGEGANRSCLAVIRVSQNKQIVIVWELGRGTDGAMRAVMHVPTGVSVKNPVELKIGNSVAGTLAYTACMPEFCEVIGTIDDALQRKLAAASEVTVTVRGKDGKDVSFKFPVKGIDKAVAALSS